MIKNQRFLRIEVLSVYLDVKYKISGTVCQHVLPRGHGTMKTGLQEEFIHVFIHLFSKKAKERQGKGANVAWEIIAC